MSLYRAEIQINLIFIGFGTFHNRLGVYFAVLEISSLEGHSLKKGSEIKLLTIDPIYF